ncbi:MAG: hypothetical protein ACXVB1_15175 [Pseudobdellovibrionaceae bacterium]
MRKLPLLFQRQFEAKDLILAILMDPRIRNSRIVGPYYGESDTIAQEEIEILLWEYSTQELDAVIVECLSKQWILKGSAFDHTKEAIPGFSLTTKGVLEYQQVSRLNLKIPMDASICDVSNEKYISIFFAWQSEYGTSRNQISEALDFIVNLGNNEWNPVRELKVVQATDTGDGAVNITEQLKSKITAADIFVGDITPVIKFNHRLYPNSNVLLETGYAMGKKEKSSQVILLESLRNSSAIDGDKSETARFPFDLDQIRRISYDAPKDLRAKLSFEIKTVLAGLGLLLAVESDV